MSYRFILFFVVLCSSAFVYSEKSFYTYDQLESNTSAHKSLVIHMMFFPWDRQQHLLEDELNFDHKPYFEMQERVKKINGRVVMWTYSKAKGFCQKYYPEIWETLQKSASRPVMYVDVLRWLVVYHFGGIYWQYHSIPLVRSMKEFLPRKGKQVRLFTECIITPEFAQQMALQPIRKGQPEELVRVATQVFSCSMRKSKSIKKLIDFYTKRLATEVVRCDYDILYISGNAGMSEFYDQVLKHDSHVELIGLNQVRAMINFNSKSSWRLDEKK